MNGRFYLALVACCATVNGAWAVADVPLKQVVLFNSGVGYFDRRAVVEGDDSSVLQFSVDQINDVIKSLVLFDENGGSIGAVTYDSRDPVERTLKTYRIDLSDSPDRLTLFNRMRGVAVRVKTSGSDFEGRILGVEQKELKEDDVVRTIDYLTLSGAGGLRTFRFDDLQSLEFTDEAIRADLSAALGTLAGNLDRDKKSLKLSFNGKGKRKVSVGYMLETPVWKTSYRMVIEGPSLYLQGWAHVENTTDEDWTGVSLSLVSGRPVSFIQNLYDPIYVKRPVVELETYGGAAPQMYGKGMAGALHEAMPAEAEMFAMDAAAPAPMAAPPRMNLARMRDSGVASAATGESAGELFEYAIDTPVTLPRQQSAMLPIVDESVKGAPLSIYSSRANAKYPMNGVELDNSSKLFLMQGPVSVFEEGIYAGDARLPDTRPSEKVLLSYSLDLATEVRMETENKPEEIVSVKIVRGALFLQKRYLTTTKYAISSKRGQERTLTIEQPIKAGWDLIEPSKDVEKTTDQYRFRLQLAAGKTRDFNVKEQRVGEQQILLSNLNDRSVDLFLSQKEIPSEIKNALKKLVTFQSQLAAIRTERKTIEEQIQRIVQEQGRIRKNMEAVDKNSESFSRWERKLTQQEDEIEGLNTRFDALKQDEQRKQKEIDDYIAGVNVE
ncbi:MAG TPA: hypothetical protein DCZ95_10415 [Verrucomicrobia bacterium]|nr:MAG: hypothetical protein A2X46_18730 [Lentisphaerae bacterium GWF2_57_35]HBA84495.1 hypothetical protein [Verrucomicrobiota bacterium]